MRAEFGWISITLLCAAIACDKTDDCELYHTCPGDLIQLAVADLDEADKPECRQCLQEKCAAEADACSVDWKCNLIARCRMTMSQLDHQRCIGELRRHGYTTGEEIRKPWQGEESNSFDDCRRSNCYAECSPHPFDCGDALHEYAGGSVTLAVRKFGGISSEETTPYAVANQVKARACHGADCDDTPFTPADERGHIQLMLEAGRPAESLYFEIRPNEDAGPADFPPTLYYPRMMGQGGHLFASVYLVRNADIKIGNQYLGYGHRVLEDTAQSVILPDGCTYEPISVAGMTIQVKRLAGDGTEIPQCHQDQKCFPNCVAPCVWYARATSPARAFASTDWSGGGAVALLEGAYEVEARDKTGALVARRRVEMKKGWMTIVRTWPVRPPR